MNLSNGSYTSKGALKWNILEEEMIDSQWDLNPGVLQDHWFDSELVQDIVNLYRLDQVFVLVAHRLEYQKSECQINTCQVRWP